MRVALMIEGQEDVTWDDWVALAEACESGGLEALFRSDHYLAVIGDDRRGALDTWGTINALAARTSTLRLGTMVSPASFRQPLGPGQAGDDGRPCVRSGASSWPSAPAGRIPSTRPSAVRPCA
jgi:hypothetical protein